MTMELTATMTMSPIEDRWLAPNEAANYLSVSPDTLSKWRLRGIGPKYSAAFGRDPRYRLSDLIRYMGSKMVSNTREAKMARRH